MANNYNPQPEFTGYAEGGRYQPGQIASIVPHMKEEHRRQQQGFQNYINAVAENHQRMIRAASMAGDDMRHLSKLSATLSKTFFELDEWYKKDAEINDTYDALMGGQIDGEILENERRFEHDVAQVSAEGRERVEELGGPSAALQFSVETPFGQQAPRYASGLQGLSMAQTSYAPFLQGWSQSNAIIRIPGYEGTVAGAYLSGDSRIIAAATMLGRQTFFKSLNLEGTTKADVVKYLSTTVPQAEGALNMTAVNAGTKERREQHRQQIAGQGYTAAQTLPHSDLQTTVTNLSDTYYFSGAAATRREANQLAVKTVISGLEDKGDVEGLRVLLGVQKIPGQPGTELANEFGPDINKAIINAGRNRNNLDRLNADEVERRMYADLAKAPTSAARQERVESAAQELESLGLYEQARELREQSADLGVKGNSSVNAANLLSQVRQGLIVDSKVIDQAVLRGDITAEQGQEIKNTLTTEYEFGKPTDKLGADVAKATTQRTTKTFETSLGLRRDVTGNIISISGAALTAGEAEIITAQIERDINAETNQWLRSNPGLSEQQKLIGLNNHLNEWYKQNVETEGGKYYISPGLRGGKTDNAFDKDAEQKALGQRMRGLIQKPATFSTPNTNFGKFGDKDYALPQSFDWTPGSGLSRVDAQQFNPVRGDIVFTPAAVGYYAQDYNEKGIIDQNLVLAAEQLGMSPMSLLRQQISAHGLDIPLKAPPLTSQGSSKARLTAVEGGYALMSRGLPSKGAAWLSGNIKQESGWNGQRTWGEVAGDGSDRNGGLVSWMDDADKNHFRLRRIEQHLGKPIEQASTDEQIDAMLWELKTHYPSADRIFRNPYATDRQLIRASREYWGYGHEGNRFLYARDVERQLQRVPQNQRADTVSLMNMPPKQRTIAVGNQIIQQFGLKPWQHPNFDADKGFVAEGGARNWERPYNSLHNHNQALDIPLHPYGAAKLDELYAYLQKNRKALGITQLLWRCKNHNDHLHIGFG